MIVIGLTIGHVMFNFQAKVTEYSEPCCSSDEIQTEGAAKKKNGNVNEAKKMEVEDKENSDPESGVTTA